ncbi:MAG: DUF4019 domain-containing protein [Caulobacteraceae bacterium]
MKTRWAVLILSGLLAGCSAGRDTTATTQAVDGFHRMLDAEQFDQIYSASSDDLKHASTQARFTQFLAAVHRKLGPTRQTKQSGWNDNYATGGHFMTIRFDTTFASGQGSETFVYRLNDGVSPQLVGYHISSDALVLN